MQDKNFITEAKELHAPKGIGSVWVVTGSYNNRPNVLGVYSKDEIKTRYPYLESIQPDTYIGKNATGALVIARLTKIL